ncbi:MAG: hypothetical protein K2X27_19545, partial [Candidatus Obscuribacterales bacterium]|nr:hypothetical protein [Candidatus Obscuribacterales bacterium]
MRKKVDLTRKLCSLLLSLEIGSTFAAVQAQTADTSSSGTSSTGVNLDLSSTQRTTAANTLLGGGAVAINLAGSSVTINSTDVLTPAELVAVQQVMTTGTQTLQLGPMGNAVGGSINLTNLMPYQSLILPAGVTGLRDFGVASSLNISGNFTNAGTFYAVSSVIGSNTAIIQAANIFNQPGALLTTVLPPGGLAGFNNLLSQVNLTLLAQGIISNAGTISSSGNLTAIAGTSIINAPGPAGLSPVMQAMMNMNLQALNIVNQGQIQAMQGNMAVAAANLNNSAIMQALVGNLNINNIAGSTLNINNIMGTLQAGGSLDIRTAAQLNEVLNVLGGTLAGSKIAISADKGIQLDVERIVGPLELSAPIVRAGVSSGNLLVDKMAANDPMIYNTSGDIVINGAIITPGEDLAIVASGNIIAGKGAGIIDSSSPTGSGGDITMLAGVNFTANGPVLTVTGASATGGYIDLE